MVEFVHDNIIIEIRRCLFREVLRIEGLNRHKKIFDTIRLAAADKHFTEIGILQHRAEGIKALLQDLLSMGDKQQAAGMPGVLFAEALVIQRRNDRFTGAGCRNNEIVTIAAYIALGVQLVQNLLLIGVGPDIHGVDLGIVGVKVFFRL